MNSKPIEIPPNSIKLPTQAEYLQLRRDLLKIAGICQPLAGNRHFMQVAGPARQILNIIKPYITDAPRP